jgi:cyanophycin synthetase
MWTQPLLLRGLYVMAMAKAFLRYRNPRRKSSGRHQREFYERMWKTAAQELGGTCTHLGSDISQIDIDGQRTRVYHNVSTIDDPVTLAVLHDKPLTHRLLQAENLSVPRHAMFSLKGIKIAVEFLKNASHDCVVKPAGGTGGGRGVTTGIQTIAHLARASAAAAVYCDELLIEEQIEGDNYRLLYLDGKLIDSFLRQLPMVVGDGKSTIARLVQIENAKRLQNKTGVSQVLLSKDMDMRRTLAKQGLSLRSVPTSGKSITIKCVVNENSGADNATATRLFCDSIVRDGERAVRALGVRFAGIDIVTRDPSVSLAESGGVILEVNGTPNLYYHYKKKDGAFPVATHLLRRLLSLSGDRTSNHSAASVGDRMELSNV